MIKHIHILDWRGDNFKLARELLKMSVSDVLEYIRGPYGFEDIQECEFVDAYVPAKDELAHIYNELLIAEGLEYRFQSAYVLYGKIGKK